MNAYQEKHITAIDNALDALAEDSNLTATEYREVLADAEYRISVARIASEQMDGS